MRSGVKRFINVYVNEDNIRDKKNLETELKPGDTISILPSIAGGKIGVRLHLVPNFRNWETSRSDRSPSRFSPVAPKSSPKTRNDSFS